MASSYNLCALKAALTFSANKETKEKVLTSYLIQRQTEICDHFKYLASGLAF